MREVIRAFGIASSLFVLSFVDIAVAQKGLAPNGYYPYGYGGLTFTGEVVEIDEQNQNLTLAFTKNDKTEKFIGHLLAPCGVNSKPKPKTITVASLPPGTVLTAYYNETSKKIDGNKVKENDVIIIRVLKYHGQTIPENQQIMSLCTDQKQLTFRAW